MDEGYQKSKLLFINELISVKSKRKCNKQTKVAGAGENVGAQIPWEKITLSMPSTLGPEK